MKRRSFDESDLIRLNLEQLDHQVHAKPLFERILDETPALPYVAAFLLGIVFLNGFQDFPVVGMAFLAAFFAVIALLCSMKMSPPIRLRLAVGCGCVLFFSLGVVRYSLILDIPPDHISRYLRSEREPATLRGTVVSEVRVNDAFESSIPWLPSKSSFYLNIAAVKGPDGWHRACGKVRVQVSEPVRHVRAGNTVEIYCWLSRFSPPANPGEFDIRTCMHQRGVTIAAAVAGKDGIEVLDASGTWMSSLRSALYHYTSDALLDETLSDPDAAALVSALLLGRRSSLNPRTAAAFRDTNLAHYISLSGMHVGILAGSLWLVLRSTGLAKRPRAVLCIILILLYALVVPPRAPTMRAIFLSCFFFASVLLKVRSNPLNTLAISAGVLSFFRPYDTFSAGWQLSFLSVLGILLFYRPVRYQLLSWLFYPGLPVLKSRLKGILQLIYGVLEMLAVGISAWLAIAAILLYYFGRINPLSPLWTVLVFPFVTVILYAGFLKIIFSSILPTLAAVLGLILNAACTGFEKSVMVLANVDLFQLTSHRPSLMLIAAIYGLIGALCLTPAIHDRIRKLMWIALIGCFFYPALSRHLDIRNGGTLDLACLSVGHGQAIVLSGPDNEHILFDAGSVTHNQIARKIILPYLQHRRIFNLDAVYISHGDLDHLNAVYDLAASVRVHNIRANRVFLETAQTPSLEKELKDQLETMGKPVRPIEAPPSGCRMQIRSLWPIEDHAEIDMLSKNNRCEVFLIDYAGRKILLCGDIEKQAQQELLLLYPGLTADVLVLPHHGSMTNLDNGFVEHLNPRIVIASGSSRTLKNAYRPPADSAIQRFHTAADGAVQVKIKADGTLRADGYLKIQN